MGVSVYVLGVSVCLLCVGVYFVFDVFECVSWVSVHVCVLCVCMYFCGGVFYLFLFFIEGVCIFPS